MQSKTELTITRPDDWHLHLRDGEMLRAVLPFSAQLFGRAMIMPNLKPPVRTIREAQAYRKRILDCLPSDHGFVPLMTLYLTETTQPAEIQLGLTEGLLAAVKFYPAGATTHSEHGVRQLKAVYPVFEVLQETGLPLSVHGEVSDPEVDIFDREAVFIERVLEPLRRDFPELKVVLEHVTSQQGVEYVRSVTKGLAATITPQHLLINRNNLFAGGFNPHLYCLPVAKREEDRQALQEAAVSGDSCFFFGSDSAPHLIADKEKQGAAAGVFSSPYAVCFIAQVFEAESALDNLEAFLSLNGSRFYGLPPNQNTITLRKSSTPVETTESVAVGQDRIIFFAAGLELYWQVIGGMRPDRDR